MKTFRYLLGIVVFIFTAVLLCLNVPPDARAGEADGLIADFGNKGLWYYRNFGGGDFRWKKLHPTDVENLVTFNSCLATTLRNGGSSNGKLGVYDIRNGIPKYTFADVLNPEAYIAYDNGSAAGLVIDRGTNGLWFFDGALPEEVPIELDVELTWADIANPVAFGNRLAVTYGEDPDLDLYQYDPADSPPWTLISTIANEGYIAYQPYSEEGLAIDLGTEGFWFYDGSLPMTELTWADIERPVAFSNRMAVTYKGDLYEDLYEYDPADTLQSWTRLARTATEKYIEYNNGLVADGGSVGLWFYDGSLPWVELTWADIENPVSFGNRLAVTYAQGNINKIYAFDPDTGTWARTMSVNAANQGYVAYGDSDDDGLPDWVEKLIIDADEVDHITTIQHVFPEDNFDADGLTNIQEFNLGTDLRDADSDNDSLSDGWEHDQGWDPLVAENSDTDGLTDGIEDKLGTDPLDGNPANPGAVPDIGHYFEYDAAGRIKSVVRIQ